MDEFEAREWMKGTSFSLGDDERTVIKEFPSMREKEEIEDMLEMARDRMEFYKKEYLKFKVKKDKAGQLSAVRNFKALEGLYFGLRWVLKDSEVDHPLY